MLENNNYVLFLRKSKTDECYIINGITIGKVLLDDSSEKSMIKGLNSSISSEIKDIHNQAIEKYIKSK